jgi:hypothetical protein
MQGLSLHRSEAKLFQTRNKTQKMHGLSLLGSETKLFEKRNKIPKNIGA